jgi:hypothetical protein
VSINKAHSHKINFANDLHTQELTKLEEEIAQFDSVLDRIQRLMPEDMRVYDHIAQTRDAMFRLQQSMRGCEIVEFACSGLDDTTTTTTEEDIDYFSWRRDD